MKKFIEKIEEINAWLEKEFWPEHNDGKVPDGADWLVGEERGLVCRKSPTLHELNGISADVTRSGQAKEHSGMSGVELFGIRLAA